MVDCSVSKVRRAMVSEGFMARPTVAAGSLARIRERVVREPGARSRGSRAVPTPAVGEPGPRCGGWGTWRRLGDAVNVRGVRSIATGTERPAAVLHGRTDERELLDRLLEAVRRGQSRVL